MDISVNVNGETIVVEASGELNIYCAADLLESLKHALNTGKGVTVDLSRVESIDASCLQILGAAKMKAIGLDIPIEIVGLSEPVNRMIGLIGLDRYMFNGAV